MIRFCSLFFVVVGLSSIALWRGGFSPEMLMTSLEKECFEEEFNTEILQQPYFFLAKGRQSFAFVSQDGKWVLKFFNRKYVEMPWYSFVLNGAQEKHKRERRRFFALQSYTLASHVLKEETGLVYLHNGITKHLPIVQMKDPFHETFYLDVNNILFVLQKKGDLLHEMLPKQSEKERLATLDQFLQLVDHRIALGIADGDHNVIHNFGVCDGKVFHVDPGRIFVQGLEDPTRREKEWWHATHNLRKWLEKNSPSLVVPFDEKIAFLQQKKERDSQAAF